MTAERLTDTLTPRQVREVYAFLRAQGDTRSADALMAAEKARTEAALRAAECDRERLLGTVPRRRYGGTRRVVAVFDPRHGSPFASDGNKVPNR